MLKSPSKKYLNIFFKTAVLCLAFGFVFHHLSNNQNIYAFKELISSIPKRNVILVITAVFLLMFVNWTLESVKWKYLLKPVEKITLWRAVESVFCGLTWAVFTPNRIGEYGGRVFFLSPRKRVVGLVAMAVGSIGQMVVKNILGSLAVFWFVYTFIGTAPLVTFALALLVTVFCLFFTVFYFNIRWFEPILSGIGFIKPYRRFFSILTRYTKPELLTVLLYCVSRFAVFTTQYYLVIHLLIPAIPVFSMIMMVFILFFIQSALPSLDLLDVGVRAFTASYFFGFLTDQETAIMAATACIWLVNLVIPAILGSVFVFKLNFFGKSDN